MKMVSHNIYLNILNFREKKGLTGNPVKPFLNANYYSVNGASAVNEIACNPNSVGSAPCCNE